MIEVYQSAFAEPPWNEYMKCHSCGVEYGKEEVQTAVDYCKKCNKLLELIEFWSAEEVKQDLEFALSQQEPIVLVAEDSNGLVGFTWGYRLPIEKFSFLSGKINENVNYMDEIAVSGDKRRMGIGTSLGKKYLDVAKQKGIYEIVLRTDERNIASIALFKKLGFSDIPDRENPRGRIYDPKYSDRIYLKRELGV